MVYRVTELIRVLVCPLLDNLNVNKHTWFIVDVSLLSSLDVL